MAARYLVLETNRKPQLQFDNETRRNTTVLETNRKLWVINRDLIMDYNKDKARRRGCQLEKCICKFEGRSHNGNLVSLSYRVAPSGGPVVGFADKKNRLKDGEAITQK